MFSRHHSVTTVVVPRSLGRPLLLFRFQPDKLNADQDLGDLTLGCGRKADAFKLWLMWKALGDAGFAARVDHACDLIAHMARALRDARDARGRACAVVVPGFEAPAFANLCFYVVPPSMRDELRAAGVLGGGDGGGGAAAVGGLEAASPDQLARLGAHAPRLKDRMQRAGGPLVGYMNCAPRFPNCWRMVIAGDRSMLTTAGIDAIVENMLVLSADC